MIIVLETPISLALSTSMLVIGSTPMNLVSATVVPIRTIGSEKITADSAGHYVIQGQTLTHGGAIVVSGTPISLVPHAKALVAGLRAFDLASKPALGILTIGLQTITADSLGRYIVAG